MLYQLSYPLVPHLKVSTVGRDVETAMAAGEELSDSLHVPIKLCNAHPARSMVESRK